MADELPVCPVSELTRHGQGSRPLRRGQRERPSVRREPQVSSPRRRRRRGSIDKQGCLVCPWHGARYDVETGRMEARSAGLFAQVPGLGAGNTALTRFFPFRRGNLVERDATVFVR
jgi:Rieske [2Fe-2S] domain